jgi:hypothetical protein
MGRIKIQGISKDEETTTTQEGAREKGGTPRGPHGRRGAGAGADAPPAPTRGCPRFQPAHNGRAHNSRAGGQGTAWVVSSRRGEGARSREGIG